MARPKKDPLESINDRLKELEDERSKVFNQLDKIREEEKPLLIDKCILEARQDLGDMDDFVIVAFAKALASRPPISWTKEEDLLEIARTYQEKYVKRAGE